MAGVGMVLSSSEAKETTVELSSEGMVFSCGTSCVDIRTSFCRPTGTELIVVVMAQIWQKEMLAL